MTKDQYLRATKNRDQFQRKVVMGGGFEVQPKGRIPVLPTGVRALS